MHALNLHENTSSGSRAGNNNDTLSRMWTLFTNSTMMIAWARVLKIILHNYPFDKECNALLTPVLTMALYLGFLEFWNALLGVTRSKPAQTLLFSVVRAGVELLVAPHLPCHTPLHIFTATCWAAGDTIRFGCFLLDQLVPGARLAKYIRYTVGPILFPFGALGEMLMVIQLGNESQNWYLYVAASLWPLGFYPLMKQLLKQRRKFMDQAKEKKVN